MKGNGKSVFELEIRFKKEMENEQNAIQMQIEY